MIIASCVLKLRLSAVYSLKDKRQIVKSVLARLPREFNVAVAEVAYQDVWQTTGIALVTVGTDSSYLHSLLEKAVQWVGYHRPDAIIDDYQIEMVY